MCYSLIAGAMLFVIVFPLLIYVSRLVNDSKKRGWDSTDSLVLALTAVVTIIAVTVALWTKQSIGSDNATQWLLTSPGIDVSSADMRSPTLLPSKDIKEFTPELQFRQSSGSNSPMTPYVQSNVSRPVIDASAPPSVSANTTTSSLF